MASGKFDAQNQAQSAETTLDVLGAVSEDETLSQRNLADRLGIALGLTNAVLKRCVKKGLLKIQQVPARRYAYYLTPKGFAEKSRLTSEYLTSSFKFFRRAKVQCAGLLQDCERRGILRIGLIGVSDLSEIVSLSALDSKVELAGIVDSTVRIDRFAGHPVYAAADRLGPVDALMVTTLKDPQGCYDKLRRDHPEMTVLHVPLLRITDKEAKKQSELIDRALVALRDGKPARLVELTDDEVKAFRNLQLLTQKPVLYVCNVDEGSAATGNEYSDKVAEKAAAENAGTVVISAAIEAEVAQLDAEERIEFLADLGLNETGLGRIIRAGYDLLHLITYFTVGPKECRAWTVTKGTKAPQAAGVIHTDFEKGFIRAETIAYSAYVEHGGENGAKDAGLMRLEGKEYIVQDGDVLHFRFAN